MSTRPPLSLRLWRAVPAEMFPFADAVEGLPLGRLARLALVQVSVGMAMTLLNGTLNRIMIVEIGVPAGLVSAMIALPLLIAPVRAIVGLRSDSHRSVFGWRRVPYIWMGTMAQFGGLALVPMSLMLMSGTGAAPAAAGKIGALFAFALIGIGLHTTQTAALALACDNAPAERRPRVVALLYVVLLIAMFVASLVFGALLEPFTPRRLFAAVSGAAMVTVALNLVALWKQEGRGSAPPADAPSAGLSEAWAVFNRGGRAKRVLVGVALATAAFNMQDVLLEPYGGEILHLSVGATTMLTALWAVGSLMGFGVAARRLGRGSDPYAVAAVGVLIGLPAFAAVIFAGPLAWPLLFRTGTVLIGVGGGIASIALLHAATALAEDGRFGFAIGAWGAVQATSAGLAVLTGGILRDAFRSSAMARFVGADGGYALVYHVEIALLFAALVALGPLVSRRRTAPRPLALTEFPA